MIHFTRMNQEDFSIWRENAILEYAENKIKAGNVKPEEAVEQSRRDYDILLPDGLETPDHLIYNVMTDDGLLVGNLWVHVRNHGQELYICEVKVEENVRSKGFGTQILQLLEQQAKKLGISKISLHVFGHNEVAQGLYRKMGFAPTNVLMSKVVTRE